MTLARPEDRTGKGVLTYEECLSRLRSARVGRIAFLSDGFPVILPVNHGMDRDTVVFRTAGGTTSAAADLQLPVAFEVDGFDADRRTGAPAGAWWCAASPVQSPRPAMCSG